MCGIIGCNWPAEKLLCLRGLKALQKRGPDDSGMFCDASVSLGQTRLSILDLTERGHQPMGINTHTGKIIYTDKELSNADVIIVFNGEIYNFQRIREELPDYHFETNSDTEVLLKAYLRWGTQCVKKFNGMWAFCIYDKKKKLLFCSRDRLGVKPFYYFWDGQRFAFASELKGIRSLLHDNTFKISKEGMELYFCLGYIPAPYSIYDKTFKLEARQNLVLDLDKKKLKKWQYYTIKKQKSTQSKQDIIKKGREILTDAVKLRLMSDVPVGAFLSGGLDSSSVVGEMNKNMSLFNLHTFSVGFHEKGYDETVFINIVRKHYKTIHHHYYFKRKDFNSILKIYPDIYDEPFSDYSCFPTYKISTIAKKNVTVVLSGDGGDEIFAGYTSHLLGARMDFLRKIPVLIRKLFLLLPAKKNLDGFLSLYLLKKAILLTFKPKKCFYSESLPTESLKTETFKRWSEEKLDYCLKKTESMADAMRLYDLLFNTLPDNFLTKVDRASMYTGVEVRSPFLDYRFVELSQEIPTAWKVNLFETKIIMRDIVKDLVPKDILNRGKQGFKPPIDKWITEKKYAVQMKKYLEKLRILSPQIYWFYKEKVFKENNALNTEYKIRLFLFGTWQEKWSNDAPSAVTEGHLRNPR